MRVPATALPEAAVSYRQMGLSVIPVGRDKVPLVEWAEYQRELPHPDEVAVWWDQWPGANIGVVTGSVSRLVVLDADGPKGLASLKALGTPGTTWLSRTGRPEGGWQQFFQHPGVRVPNRAGLRPGLDVRGDGGYVIVPPSVHASGRRYEWLTAPGELPLEPFPEPILGLLLTPPPNGHPPTEEGAIPQGQRNDHLYRIARAIHARGITPAALLAALLEENLTRCAPPLSEAEVREIAEHANRQPDRADFTASRTTMVKTTSQTPTATASEPILVRLADVAPESVSWLWPGCLARGKLTLLVGDPGLGKSLVTLDAAARVSTGREWPDAGHAPLGDVVLLTAEDGLADTVRPRLDALDGDAARVHVLRAVRQGETERGFGLAADLPALESSVTRTAAGLVVIDPLSAYLGKTDSYKDAEVRGLLAPLATLAERHSIAVLVVMHLTKDSQRPAIHRPGGSIGFVGAARVVLAVGRDSEDEERRLLVPVKSNLTAPPPALAYRVVGDPAGRARVQWEPDPVEGADADALLAQGAPVDREERREADDLLRELLAEGERPAAQMFAAARANGISDRTLKRAKWRLDVQARHEGRPGQPGGAWWWSLPEPAGVAKGANNSPKSAPPDEVAPFEEVRASSLFSSPTCAKGATSPYMAPFGGPLRDDEDAV